MNITRPVIEDLLTMYLAGEASSDTRALVEEWLRNDPELARRAAEAREVSLPAPARLAPTTEKRALDRTRRLLRRRTLLFGMAIYVTLLPLTVTFNRSGFNGLLIDNWPERIVVLAVAAVLWVVYWRMSRPLRSPAA